MTISIAIMCTAHCGYVDFPISSEWKCSEEDVACRLTDRLTKPKNAATAQGTEAIGCKE